MKRVGIVLGIWLLTAGMPVWGQSVTAVTAARQQADAAAADIKEPNDAHGLR